jgi:DNA modification methylase
MTPYWMSDCGRFTVYCADCREVLPHLTGVDCVVTDPPFNVGKKYGDGHNDRKDNYREWCAEWIAECFRLLKPTGTVYVMTIARHLEWKMPLMAKHGVFVSLIPWKNVTASHDKRRYWNAYQPIMCYGKTEAYKFNTYAQVRELPKPSWQDARAERQKGQLLDWWDDIPLVYAGSVVHPEAILNPGTCEKAHPCQMPTGIATRAILFSSDARDTILDPFMGSGTTGVACVRLGRRFIGIEIHEPYCKIAVERIQRELAQGDFIRDAKPVQPKQEEMI